MLYLLQVVKQSTCVFRRSQQMALRVADAALAVHVCVLSHAELERVASEGWKALAGHSQSSKSRQAFTTADA